MSEVADSKKIIKAILALFAVALAFRVVAFLLFPEEFVFGRDQIENTILAQNLASGNWAGALDTYWPPLYPLLIGIVSLFSDSLTFPSIALSILVGALVAPITLLFTNQSYGYRVAVVAAIISIFYPQLVNKSAFLIGTEGIYLLLLISAAYFGWRTIQKGTALDSGISAVLLGLAYLTRPEAIGYFLVALFVIAFLVLKNEGNRRSTALRCSLAFILGFLIFAGPYIVYLRAETGQWTISGKVERNVWILKPIETNIVEGTDTVYVAPSRFQKARNIIHNLISLNFRMPSLLPILLFALALFGLFYSVWDKGRFSREMYLLAIVGLTVLCYVATFVQIRYFYLLLPIIFGWIAKGILSLGDWLEKTASALNNQRVARFASSKAFVAASLIVIFVYCSPTYRFAQTRDTPVAERKAGHWLQNNGKPGARIFSPDQRPAFYARGEYVRVGFTELDQFVLDLRKKNVDYVVTSERALRKYPQYAGLEEQLAGSEEFEKLYENRARKGYGVVIFKLKKLGE